MSTTSEHSTPNRSLTKDAANARLLGLDVLRLFAVVLVIGRHTAHPPEDWPLIPKFAIDTWRQGGWIGVDLFFVLSGFLVSGLLFREYKARGQFVFGRFYVRRGWKIYPPFIALIAATLAVRYFAGREVWDRSLASEAFFLQSYIPGMWIHTWSLAVEEHFYLLLPWALYLILKLNGHSPDPLKPILGLALGVAVLSLALRAFSWHWNPEYRLWTHQFPSHLRLDSLFFGVAIAYFYHFHTDWFVETFTRWRAWLIIGGVSLLLPAFAVELDTAPRVFTTIGVTAFYLASGAILTGVLLYEFRPHPLIVAAAAVGAYSYSIYLWHMPVAVWSVRVAEKLTGAPIGFEARTSIYVVGSIVFGIAMAKIIEVPALRIRDAWFPSRTTPNSPRQASEVGPTLATSWRTS